MRFKSLRELDRTAPREIALASLPEQVLITDFAKAKAFLISELVRRLHGEAFEWYGFTLAERGSPEIIVDVGLPHNDENQENYTSISAERIAAYQDTLPAGRIINGWLHSHGDLEFRHFSTVDDLNQATVLDYVTSLIMLPVSQKEVVIRDLALLVMGQGEGEGLDAHAVARSGLREKAAPGAAPASVTLFTDVPVSRARLLETVYGGFCYAIVIGDDGWIKQEIHYKTRGILTGETLVSHRQADLVLLTTGKLITPSDQEALEEEVRDRIRPTAYKPENIERM